MGLIITQETFSSKIFSTISEAKEGEVIWNKAKLSQSFISLIMDIKWKRENKEKGRGGRKEKK